MTVSPCVNGVSAKRDRVLIIGATGFMGQFVAQASLDSGKPTYVLLRSFPSCLLKAKATKAFQDQGAIILLGAMENEELMEKILKDHEIDIVISAAGGDSILDQLYLVRAIKSVGTVKRFLPSEFGHDVDRVNPVEPGLSMYKDKRRVRRLIEELGIPYSYICCNSIASWPYYDNTHPSQVLPPVDQFPIYGDGTVKGYFVAGADIGKFTMMAVDDERTLNKSVHFRPSCNFLNMNELADLWEKKIGTTLPRVTVSEDDLLAAAAEKIIPRSIVAAFTHDIFIKGCQTNFSSNGPDEVEVSSLYPDEPFITVDECFDEFAVKIKDKHGGPTPTTNGPTTANVLVDFPK